MNELLMFGAEAAPIALGTVYLLAHRRAVHRRRCVRYANMLLAELGRMRNFVDRGSMSPSLWRMATEDRSAYDGLVSSGNMSWFDTGVQEELAWAYGLLGEIAFHLNDHVDVPQMAVDLFNMLHRELLATIADVEAFRERNLTRGSGAIVLKALRLAYDD